MSDKKLIYETKKLVKEIEKLTLENEEKIRILAKVQSDRGFNFDHLNKVDLKKSQK